MSKSRGKRRAIRNISHAIRELKEARRLVRRNRFERAENEIGDALVFIGRAIRNINRAERRRRRRKHHCI